MHILIISRIYVSVIVNVILVDNNVSDEIRRITGDTNASTSEIAVNIVIAQDAMIGRRLHAYLPRRATRQIAIGVSELHILHNEIAALHL